MTSKYIALNGFNDYPPPRRAIPGDMGDRYDAGDAVPESLVDRCPTVIADGLVGMAGDEAKPVATVSVPPKLTRVQRLPALKGKKNG